jgi:hypothetical protein
MSFRDVRSHGPFSPGRGRAWRGLVMLAASGVLGVAGVTAGTAAPAFAGPNVQLSANPTFLLTGEQTELTAPPTGDKGVSEDWLIYVFDTTTGAFICKGFVFEGCGGFETQSVATTHDFVAYLVSTDVPDSIPPAADVLATSTPVAVTWEPVHIIP